MTLFELLQSLRLQPQAQVLIDLRMKGSLVGVHVVKDRLEKGHLQAVLSLVLCLMGLMEL